VKITAIGMVRNEADVIGYTISHLLEEGVDEVLVLDNGSVDGTTEILHALGVTVIPDPEVGYYQSLKMTRLAHQAMDGGADWIIPFDADELWYSPYGRLAEVLPSVSSRVAQAAIIDHRPDDSDSDDHNPYTRMPYRLVDPLELGKVAFRADRNISIGQGNHDVYNLDHEGRPWVEIKSRNRRILSLRHVPYRSFEQLARKVRQGAEAYAATDLSLDLGDHWRNMGAETDEQLLARWEQMYEWPRVYDPAPYRGTWTPG
jgi:glycosyltransferase involved in cell wall biosynthesis